MRSLSLILAAAVVASAAIAATDEAWEAFRAEVHAACLALAGDTGDVTVEVNPFGSESYGPRTGSPSAKSASSTSVPERPS